MLQCYFVFFSWERSRKKRYVTKSGYQIKRYRLLHRGVGSQNAQFFPYVLIEQPHIGRIILQTSNITLLGLQSHN